MASVVEMLDTAQDARQGVASAPVNHDDLTTGLYGSAATPAAIAGAGDTMVSEAIKGRMPDLVKGASMAPKGGNRPLADYTQIMTKSARAALDLRLSTWSGFSNKAATVASLRPDFLRQFGALKAALTQMSPKDYIDSLISMLPGGGDAVKAFAAKSFTASNLGIGSVYGLTPFNLLAPSRLIYPVYTVG